MYDNMKTGSEKIQSWFLSKSDHRLIYYSSMNNSGSKSTESILIQSEKLAESNLKRAENPSIIENFLRGNLIKLNDYEKLGVVVCGTTTPLL